jgi:hypothetical protein
MSYSLLSPNEDPGFNSGAVKPFECLSRGWHLVKDQYFLFVGLCLIIVVLVSCIPFAGIIYGAWMAGIYCALLAGMSGELVSFNMITKGFGFFSPAFLVALLSGLPFVWIGIGVKLIELRFDQIEKAHPGATPIPDEVVAEQLTYSGGVPGNQTYTSGLSGATRGATEAAAFSFSSATTGVAIALAPVMNGPRKSHETTRSNLNRFV